jgi:hypothetical protein
MPTLFRWNRKKKKKKIKIKNKIKIKKLKLGRIHRKRPNCFDKVPILFITVHCFFSAPRTNSFLEIMQFNSDNQTKTKDFIFFYGIFGANSAKADAKSWLIWRIEGIQLYPSLSIRR